MTLAIKSLGLFRLIYDNPYVVYSHAIYIYNIGDTLVFILLLFEYQNRQLSVCISCLFMVLLFQ